MIEGLQGQNPASPTAQTAANGINYGQYHAPIGNYIFPENIPGSPIVENNFNTILFLARGGYSSAAGTRAAQLNPWPSSVLPGGACIAPVANAGGPYTVASGGVVTLAGSATGTTPTFAWTAGSGTLSSATIANPNFTAPASGVPPVPLTLTATNACGTSLASTTVTINTPTAPTVNPVAPVTLVAQAAGLINLSAVNPENQPLTFTVTQAGLPALVGLTVTPTGLSTALVNFSTPALPLGQLTASVVTLSITAKTATGSASALGTATVTITSRPDQITLTTDYRLSKQRLIIRAVTTVPGVKLTLQPYLTDDGVTIFDPVALGNTFTVVGGIPTLVLVGAPHPACNPGGVFAIPCASAPLRVTSNIGGDSGAQALQKIVR